MRILTILILCISFSSIAQKRITVEELYRGVFLERSVEEIRWMKDGRFYTALEENKIIKYDVTSGEEVEVLLDGGGGSDPKIVIDDYEFSSGEDKILILTDRQGIYRRSFTANYYIFNLTDQSLTLLSSEGEQSYATFSPNGNMVAFTRGNNLFYVSLDDMSEYQITKDGKYNELIHGSSDWVYEEEFSITKAFDWSSDSKKIAFISFSEKDVKEYNMQYWDFDDLYPYDYRFKYPKAGEDNSKISVTTFNVEEKKSTPVDIGEEEDIYIPRLQWTKDPNVLSVIRMNRLQNQLEILHADGNSGKSEVIFVDKDDKYIDIDNVDDLTYLSNGKHFIISSERSGFKHLYLHEINGEQVRQITKGTYQVTEFIGVKEDRRLDRSTVYFQSTATSPLDRTLHSIDLTGKNLKLLSPERGTSSMDMSTDFQYLVLKYEDANTPLQVSLHQLKKNSPIKIKDLEKNTKLLTTLKEYSLPGKEFYTFPGEDKSLLNGYMLKPVDFDPNNKYPVLVFQYSGPGSQNVANNWGGGTNYHWHQMLTQMGYIVAVHDTRGTGYRGAAFEKVTYKQLGKFETEDHIAGAKYLRTLPYVDSERIGIWGWSYGGYISSLAMFLGGDYFKTGIAVAPVTQWRFYDTIYTERYMQKPQDNPSGYDDNSPVTHASKLNGNFLLVHGTGDDNVHFQNSIALQDELILHGKQFQSFYYPNRSHGIGDYNARVHLFNMMTNFIKNNL